MQDLYKVHVANVNKTLMQSDSKNEFIYLNEITDVPLAIRNAIAVIFTEAHWQATGKIRTISIESTRIHLIKKPVYEHVAAK